LHAGEGVALGQADVDDAAVPGRGADGDAFAVFAPLVRAQVVRHVEAGERAGGAEVGVHAEEWFAEVGGGFEVGEEVGEEVGGGADAGVFVVIVVVVIVDIVVIVDGGGGFILEDDDFVDAEDGEGSGDGAGEVGLLVVGLCTVGVI
jgi:hypothetical protein